MSQTDGLAQGGLKRLQRSNVLPERHQEPVEERILNRRDSDSPWVWRRQVGSSRRKGQERRVFRRGGVKRPKKAKRRREVCKELKSVSSPFDVKAKLVHSPRRCQPKWHSFRPPGERRPCCAAFQQLHPRSGDLKLLSSETTDANERKAEGGRNEERETGENG